MDNVQVAKHDGGMPPQKQYTIVINGREKIITTKAVSFEEIVGLSGLPSGQNTVFTVTYRRAPGQKHEGTMVPGETVEVKDGMIFNVTATNKS